MLTLTKQALTEGHTPDLLRIGELARYTETGKATIEHYLKLGLIEPARVEGQGYRLFAPESVERLRLVKKARLAGFGLPEVHAMFSALPLQELDDMLASVPALRCRDELRARGVSLVPGVA